MLATEGFDRRGGVDVGDGNNRLTAIAARTAIGEHLLDVGPALLELIGLSHVGHRATGGEIRKDHLLMIAAQHVRAFRHEVHAAEDDELGVGVLADLTGQLVGVAGVVGEGDHFVALIVMSEDHEASAERGLGRRDATVHLLVGEPE